MKPSDAHISDLMISRIKDWEQGPKGGFAATAYRSPAGDWTIGYGHTRNVTESTTCDQVQALGWLQDDLAAVQDGLQRVMDQYSVFVVTQGQWDALVSLCFNAFAPTAMPSKAPKLWSGFVHGGNTGPAFEFLSIDHALVNGVMTELPGLSLRRAFEACRFLGWV